MWISSSKQTGARKKAHLWYPQELSLSVEKSKRKQKRNKIKYQSENCDNLKQDKKTCYSFENCKISSTNHKLIGAIESESQSNNIKLWLGELKFYL